MTAWVKDPKPAQTAAYTAVEKIHFDGAHFRRDIAAKGSARVSRAYSGVTPE